jgi:hypothetical protein
VRVLLGHYYFMPQLVTRTQQLRILLTMRTRLRII